MSRHSTAHHFLEGLVDLGVDYVFANLGTDHVSLIEELARWNKEGLLQPIETVKIAGLFVNGSRHAALSDTLENETLPTLMMPRSSLSRPMCCVARAPSPAKCQTI